MEHWQKLEKSLARRLGGRITPGSGNKGIKGDVRTSDYVIEAKWRSNKSVKSGYYMDLQSEWLTKITKEAKGKEPVLAICVANLVTYCLMRYDYWKTCNATLCPTDEPIEENLDKAQIRIHAKDDWSYKVISFSGGCKWIFVPEDDFVFLVKEDKCNNQETCSRYTIDTDARPKKRVLRRYKKSLHF